MADQTIVQQQTPTTDLKKNVKIQSYPAQQHQNNQQQQQQLAAAISRERSFVRQNVNQHAQNANKRRSLALQSQHQQQQQQQQQQMRGKPAMEIYRPPNVRIDGSAPLQNKLNVHAQEFTMNRHDINNRSTIGIFPTGNILQHSKSNTSLQHQMLTRHHHALQMSNLGGPRPILVSHPIQMAGQMGMGVALQSSQMPLVNSPSSGNILHSAPRVKFAPEPVAVHHQYNQAYAIQSSINPLQRSKSLSSADAITRGIAGLGFALGNETQDIGQFPPEVKLLIDKASEDPNQLNARCLMDLSNHVMLRAVEGRRYALPISRLCISIIAKEKKETFLEALLNTCRQWYQEREKVLGPHPSSKVPSRPKFTAFMAFLTEMFCQLKRRQLQLRTQCDGVPPPLVLLTLLTKCCEDCVKPPVRSLSEIECLFFVLTCVGKDLESQLPQQLDCLLSAVRDAFLNSSASAPAIRRTLLQLIELQASHWQLPGNTVLYYYPSSK